MKIRLKETSRKKKAELLRVDKACKVKFSTTLNVREGTFDSFVFSAERNLTSASTVPRRGMCGWWRGGEEKERAGRKGSTPKFPCKTNKHQLKINPLKPCVPYLGCSEILLLLSVTEKCYAISLFTLV